MELNKNYIQAEALLALSAGREPSEKLRSDILKATEVLIDKAFPSQVTAYGKLSFSDDILLCGLGFALVGENIKALLTGCQGCAVFCATLGSAVDSAISQWSYRDRGFSLILDACANAAIEDICDQVEKGIETAGADRGQFITDRYSPGYGDLPLSVQKPLCAALDAQKRVGVTLSESCLMTPRKSVTAIIGIADSPRRHGTTGCAGCVRSGDCEFTKKGMTCYVRQG